MKPVIAAIVSVSLLLSVSPAGARTAGDPIESYCATLSESDHFASDGYPLKDAAAIIRAAGTPAATWPRWSRSSPTPPSN